MAQWRQSIEGIWFPPPHYFFYRATICQRGTRSGPVSICLSVWHAVCLDSRRYCIEVAKHGIMQSTLYDSSETLVFLVPRPWWNSNGSSQYRRCKQNEQFSTDISAIFKNRYKIGSRCSVFRTSEGRHLKFGKQINHGDYLSMQYVLPKWGRVQDKWPIFLFVDKWLGGLIIYLRKGKW